MMVNSIIIVIMFNWSKLSADESNRIDQESHAYCDISEREDGHSSDEILLKNKRNTTTNELIKSMKQHEFLLFPLQRELNE